MKDVGTDEKQKIRLVSFNCKNIKTCALIIDKLLQTYDIILIQEHWLFQVQIHLISKIHGEINYVGKGVDINDLLLPVSMPRGYGGVTVIWRKEIDHIIRPLEDGSEKLQCIEIHGNKNSRLQVISVYLPAKESKNHVTEFQECIDEIYELIQKYGNIHKILIEGDLNVDLNNASGSKRNNYLREFINEGKLKFNNTSTTFTNANGKECSEIDYFLHNLSTSSNKEVLDSITSNTSDHYPIRMEFKFEYKAYEKGNKDVQKIERKIKWEKVDKDLYSAMVQIDIDQLKSQLINNEWALDDVISKTSQVMKNAAILSSAAKTNYNAKPKLKIWTPEMKPALRIKRAKYGIWKDNGKPMENQWI
jgi:endonuclease/exonuclease/phosphatase family metal-dependent hydrolase